jgi:transposase-like protein
MNHKSSPFKWRHYAPDVILLCVRWYCRYQLSYRDVEEMMREQGIEAVNMIRKGQVKRLAGSDARGQATFVASLFQVAA